MEKKKNIHKKNILMIHPPIYNLEFGKDWKGVKSLSPPLGLMYLGTPLLKAGYNVKYIDMNVDKLTQSHFIELLKNADYILLSCYSNSIKNLKKIINLSRKVSKAYIICGGPLCKITKSFFPGSDLTVIGEAEEQIVEIVKGMKNKSFSNIPGLIYKKNKKIIKNKGVLITKNIDDSINAANILAKEKDYGYILNFKINKITGIMTSRGCPFKCKYCTFKDTNDFKLRRRSIENIIKELKDIESQGYEFIMFFDDNFLLDKKRVYNLMDRIIKEKIKLKIIVQGRVDSANLRLYKKLYRAGVIAINYGIENPNQDVLDFYDKRINLHQINNAINIANKCNIITIGYLMIGSPIETKKHYEVMKNFLKKTTLDIVNINVLVYHKGSELWQDAFNKGLIKKNEIKVFSNEKLSNHTFQEWFKMKEDLTGEFYKNKLKFLRLFYKAIKSGLLLALIKLIYNTRNDFSKNIIEAYSIDTDKGKIEI